MFKIDILMNDLFLPARDGITRLPASIQEQLAKVLDVFERDGEIRMSSAAKDGVGRYIVQVRDETNRLKPFILQIHEGDAPESRSGFFGPAYLYFVPQDVPSWRVPESPYVGRPGEDYFVEPPQVSEVLDDIRKKRQTKDYEPEADGRFKIRLERPPSARHPKGLLIIGYAVWKNRDEK